MSNFAPWFATCKHCLGGRKNDTWARAVPGCEKCAYTGRDPIPWPEVVWGTMGRKMGRLVISK